MSDDQLSKDLENVLLTKPHPATLLHIAKQSDGKKYCYSCLRFLGAYHVALTIDSLDQTESQEVAGLDRTSEVHERRGIAIRRRRGGRGRSGSGRSNSDGSSIGLRRRRGLRLRSGRRVVWGRLGDGLGALERVREVLQNLAEDLNHSLPVSACLARHH
jgi:hypothetical protein